MERYARLRALNFSSISYDELDQHVAETSKDFPFCGEQMLKFLLKERSIKVQRMRLRNSIQVFSKNTCPLDKQTERTIVSVTVAKQTFVSFLFHFETNDFSPSLLVLDSFSSHHRSHFCFFSKDLVQSSRNRMRSPIVDTPTEVKFPSDKQATTSG